MVRYRNLQLQKKYRKKIISLENEYFKIAERQSAQPKYHPSTLTAGTDYDIRNNAQPLSPCYLVPANRCHGCTAMDPRNRVANYVRDAQMAYHF